MSINCDAWTVVKLQRELRDRGLHVSGTKAVLCARLEEYAQETGEWIPAVPPDWKGFQWENIKVTTLGKTQPPTPIRAPSPPRVTPSPRLFNCSDYTVLKLKDELRKRGARLGGNKAELCTRLEAILREEGRVI